MAASRPSSQASRTSSVLSGSRRSHSITPSHRSVRSFSDFRAQTASVQSQPPVRREALSIDASPHRPSISPDETILDDLFDDYGTIPDPLDAVHAEATAISATVDQDPQKFVSQRFRSNSRPRLTGARTHNSLPIDIPPPLLPHSRHPVPPQLVLQHHHPEDSLAPPPLRSPWAYKSGDLPVLLHVTSRAGSDLGGDPLLFNVPLLSPDDMSLFQGRVPRSDSAGSLGSTASSQDGNTRRNSPGNKFTAFFGWKTSPKTDTESPATPLTDQSASPTPSPGLGRKPPLDRSFSAPGLGTPSPIDVKTANRSLQYGTDSPVTPFPGDIPEVQSPLHELERELREVSSELANSIKREMELEDENDRLKSDPSTFPVLSRRTSDYFSDSGSTMAKSTTFDSDTRIEELERTKRRLEQEKAKLKADYAERFATELRLRQDMQDRVNALENNAKETTAQLAASRDSEERIKELQTFLDDARRRLGQERQSHDNFEDLLAALRGELTQMRGERDNLVDEVIPQLKARIDGLESEAAEVSSLRYENSRMQQELGPNRPRMSSLAGGDRPWPTSAGIPRSPSGFNALATSGLSRSNSLMGRAAEFGEKKDPVEEQRDALHEALKTMIRRHEAQKREHARAIQRLLVDRDAGLRTSSLQSGFSKKIASIKGEMTSLRRRADEALSQKWQCEDTLVHVKMALDRAESEARSVRTMLVDNTGSALQSRGSALDSSMGKIIRRSIQLAETERDAARREADLYRQKATASSDRRWADQMQACADRLGMLAGQLDGCVQQNLDLQRSLAQELEKCETNRRASTTKVLEVQSRLKTLEEQLLAAQRASESSFAANEALADALDASARHITRLPAAQGELKARPRRRRQLSASKIPRAADGAAQTSALAARVAELESAVLAAEDEMGAVVAATEKGRAVVEGLRVGRENAGTEMKELQRKISEQKGAALRLLA